MLDGPRIPEAPPRDESDEGGSNGVPIGSEDWRDGRTDDGEQDSDDALASDDP